MNLSSPGINSWATEYGCSNNTVIPTFAPRFAEAATQRQALNFIFLAMAKTDLFQAPDYFQIDDLLTEEHKLVRNSVRDWVKK